MKLRPVSQTGATLLLVVSLIAGLVFFGPDPATASDTSTRRDSFSESTHCGSSSTPTPFASKQGYLYDSEVILGPFGTYLGRTIAEVESQLVWWTVPYSDGRRVRIHQAMLPSLEKVTATLEAEAAQGRIYWIGSAGGFAQRTIGGSYRFSRHALGLSIDLNPGQNPFSGDNVLITDMPLWYVNAWRNAGFCWGGDWEHIKDPMHFSWMGPGAEGAVGPSLNPRPPKTTITPLAGPIANPPNPIRPGDGPVRLGTGRRDRRRRSRRGRAPISPRWLRH